MTNALDLAHDVHLRVLRLHGPPVDQLKLQKLTFYAYGAVLAHGVLPEVGEIAFSPWKHGPVNVELWHHHRGAGANPLPPPQQSPAQYSPGLGQILDDVVEIYGRLDSWSLRNESHLEQPWIDGWAIQAKEIPTDALQEHFHRKFAPGNVRLPAHLGSHASNVLDGIPPARFESLHHLAEALRSRR